MSNAPPVLVTFHAPLVFTADCCAPFHTQHVIPTALGVHFINAQQLMPLTKQALSLPHVHTILYYMRFYYFAPETEICRARQGFQLQKEGATLCVQWRGQHGCIRRHPQLLPRSPHAGQCAQQYPRRVAMCLWVAFSLSWFAFEFFLCDSSFRLSSRPFANGDRIELSLRHCMTRKWYDI